MDFLWEMQQSSRISDVSSKAHKAESKAKGLEFEVIQMRRQIDRLSLACQSMWELVREETHLTEKDLERKILEVDGRDGRVDGRISSRVIVCDNCGRNSHSRRDMCIMCGAELHRAHKFSV